MARKRFVTGGSAPARGGGKECENLPAALQEQLESFLQKIEKMRSSFYPPDWRYDPLYLVAQELR